MFASRITKVRITSNNGKQVVSTTVRTNMPARIGEAPLISILMPVNMPHIIRPICSLNLPYERFSFDSHADKMVACKHLTVAKTNRYAISCMYSTCAPKRSMYRKHPERANTWCNYHGESSRSMYLASNRCSIMKWGDMYITELDENTIRTSLNLFAEYGSPNPSRELTRTIQANGIKWDFFACPMSYNGVLQVRCTNDILDKYIRDDILPQMCNSTTAALKRDNEQIMKYKGIDILLSITGASNNGILHDYRIERLSILKADTQIWHDFIDEFVLRIAHRLAGISFAKSRRSKKDKIVHAGICQAFGNNFKDHDNIMDDIQYVAAQIMQIHDKCDIHRFFKTFCDIVMPAT